MGLTVRALLALLCLLTVACSSLPPQPPDAPRAAADVAARPGRLQQALAEVRRQQPDARLNGFQGLAESEGALIARLALIEAADHALDLQYYIWRNDASGRLILHRLLQAADRGVKVRVLLDDHGVDARDEFLLALAAHPNFEIRLFNPTAYRDLQLLGTALEFQRVNRRMHNKALVADGQVAILGGRNIGDEYFSARSHIQFGDMDVLVHGPVLAEVEQAFDRYWQDPATYAIETLRGRLAGAVELDQLRQQLQQSLQAAEDSPFLQQLRERMQRLAQPMATDYAWGTAHLLVDDPAKIRRSVEDTRGHLLEQLRQLQSMTPGRELLIVSPYFVPGVQGSRALARLVESGVAVTVLTNSLAATDVAAVHAGYQSYRERLLAAGIRLYELKPTAPQAGQKRQSAFIGSSRASLHAKILVVDRARVFIGSPNLDPRSIQLNTEVGLVCEAPALAREVAQGLLSQLDQVAWQLELVQGKLVWVDRNPAAPHTLHQEPETSWLKRTLIRLLGLLPIESQL
ncbi:phospholipase D family protein [Roseateles sp.]|uniref:phospholipase D family protein n=1 Tax=Roseateles sp. TaxID=1971397 RepID=UPI003BA6DD1B